MVRGTPLLPGPPGGRGGRAEIADQWAIPALLVGIVVCSSSLSLRSAMETKNKGVPETV